MERFPGPAALKPSRSDRSGRLGRATGNLPSVLSPTTRLRLTAVVATLVWGCSAGGLTPAGALTGGSGGLGEAAGYAAALAETGGHPDHGESGSMGESGEESEPGQEEPGREGRPGEEGDPTGDGEDPGGDTPSGEDDDIQVLDDQNCPKRNGEELTETPWERIRLQYDRVHQISTGRGVTVAVVDTGVAVQAYQFRSVDEHQNQIGSWVTAIAGVSLPNDTGTAFYDCDGHGTFVAGLIAAQPRPENDMIGLAPDVAIYSVRYAYGQLEPDDESDADVRNMALGIQDAVNAGADVINVSSASTNDHPELKRAVEYALASDVVVVAAAGNTGNAGNPKTYPAGYEGVMAVAAVDKNGRVPPTSQSSIPISVAAPGVKVTGPATSYGLYRSDGTSFAAPLVAATAALVRARYPDLSAAEVKHRIEVTADHPGRNVPDKRYGYGIVNPYEALTAVLPPEGRETPTPTASEVGPAYTPPTPPDPAPRNAALITAGLAAVTVLLIIAGVRVYRRGQRHRWRARQDDAGATGSDEPPALPT